MGQKTSKQDDLVHAFKQAKANIVIIGVKKSGMTSILQKLIPNNPNFGGSMMGNAATTMTPYKGVNLTMWGIGFGLKRPPLWNYHLKKAEELLLIVDSGNRRTLVAMKEELDEIFESNLIHSKIPVVVFANKSDLECAKSSEEIAETMTLRDFPVRWHVQCCSALTGEGLLEGALKLSELISEKKLISPASKNIEKDTNG